METNTKLIPVEHNNQRILTTAQLAQFYGADEKYINRNYQNNKNRYIEGKHFYRLEGEVLRQFLTLQGENLPLQNVSKLRVLYLWTEKGALQHAKSLSTDEAWEKYETLVDDYYRRGDEILALQQQLAGLSQQPAPAQLPIPLFKTGREAYKTEPRCVCPSPEQLETAIVTTLRWLQPHYQNGVAGSLLMMHNEEIQAYTHIYGAGGLLAVAESLVTRQILTRSERNGAYYYSIPPIAGYIQSPEQEEEA